jgi:hypothetical protein
MKRARWARVSMVPPDFDAATTTVEDQGTSSSMRSTAAGSVESMTHNRG